MGHIDLKSELRKAYSIQSEINEDLEELRRRRRRTIAVLRELADEIDEHHLNVNISKVVGATVGIGGGIGAAVGAVLAPFSLGLSLGITAVSGAIGAAGIATATGAHIVDKIISKEKQQQAQIVLDEDHEQCQKISSKWNKFQDHCSKIVEAVNSPYQQPSFLNDVCSAISTTLKFAQSRYAELNKIYDTVTKDLSEFKDKILSKKSKDSSIIWKILKYAGSLTVPAIGAAAQKVRSLIIRESLKFLTSLCFKSAFLAVGSTVIATLLLGTSAVILISTIIDMVEGSVTKAATHLREIASNLEQEFEDWNLD